MNDSFIGRPNEEALETQRDKYIIEAIEELDSQAVLGITNDEETAVANIIETLAEKHEKEIGDRGEMGDLMSEYPRERILELYRQYRK